MMDLLVVDQLISSLKDDSLRLKLLEQRWSQLDDVTDFADNLVVARGTTRRRQSSGASYVEMDRLSQLQVAGHLVSGQQFGATSAGGGRIPHKPVTGESMGGPQPRNFHIS